MKIAFWSNVHGQTATTSNILAVSIMTALMQKEKVALMQSHFNLNGLDNALMGGFAKDLGSFNDIGMDALIRDIKSAPLSEEIIVNDSVTLLNRQLSLFPCTQKSNRDTYEKDMLHIFDQVMDQVNRYHYDAFIDTAPGRNPLTDKILEHVDLLVVNLSQNQRVIENYFEAYYPSQKKKHAILFLLGNYNYHSCYNVKNLCRKFPELKKRVVQIPYCVEFLDAQSQGKTIPFIQKNVACEKEDKNYFFIYSLKRAVERINHLRGEEMNCKS